MAKLSDPEVTTTRQDLLEEHSLTFTKQELIVIFNALISRDYRVGDAVLLYPALRRIEAIVAVDTNIPPERQGKPNGVILDK